MAKSYPEHEKMKAARAQSEPQGAFLDWLFNVKHYDLITHHRHTDKCRDLGHQVCGYSKGDIEPVYKTIEQLLAEYHGIDLKKIAREKDEMLEELRAANS